MQHHWTSIPRERFHFALVSIDDARRHTGLELEELLALPHVETVTRIFSDGRREKGAQASC